MSKVISFYQGLEKLSYSTLIENYQTNSIFKEELDQRVSALIKKENKKTKRKSKQKERSDIYDKYKRK
jgi:hypothetical protein